MAERFYVNQPLGPGPITLTGPDAHHLAVVCRLRAGDPVCLFNGDGHEYHGRVGESVGRREVTVEVLRAESPGRELPFRLVLAAPLPKGDRAQFLLEKLTELGVTDFVPLRTARSIVQPREAKLDKLQRHVIEASKQCGRNVLLHVHPLTAWADYCRSEGLPTRKLLAHPGGGSPPAPLGEDTVAAVGPEGGFTDEEVSQAREAGWQVVGLGPRILRIETAALALAVCLGR
jgi:16S rRNA (uracil1498-N3)-methyltransferase